MKKLLILGLLLGCQVKDTPESCMRMCEPRPALIWDGTEVKK